MTTSHGVDDVADERRYDPTNIIAFSLEGVCRNTLSTETGLHKTVGVLDLVLVEVRPQDGLCHGPRGGGRREMVRGRRGDRVPADVRHPHPGDGGLPRDVPCPSLSFRRHALRRVEEPQVRRRRGIGETDRQADGPGQRADEAGAGVLGPDLHLQGRLIRQPVDRQPVRVIQEEVPDRTDGHPPVHRGQDQEAGGAGKRDQRMTAVEPGKM